MFGIDDGALLSNGIKIIDGIAGGGKSSKIDAFFREQNIPYSRFTSTNRLRRDAIDRYNMPVKTIAAGLFSNNGLHFYAEEKDSPSQHVVIDEILQADPKAIDWCINHADNTNIIITTDSKQLLSPENEDVMTEAFTKLKMRKDVIYKNVTETLRPRNEKTKQIYNKFYGIADMPMIYDVNTLIKAFPNVITYDEMEYTVNDAYITHDNLTEDFLYRDKEFSAMSCLDLIPKGCLSSKPPRDLSKYPVLSQIEATKTHTRAYTQVMNVGTPVRFQGSEVTDSQKLYFIVQPCSMVSSRELYTVVTRLWDIDNFVIVICNTPSAYNLTTFHGLPVKNYGYKLVIDEEVKNTVPLSLSEMDKFVSKYDTDTTYYDRDEVLGNNHAYLYVRSDIKREAPIKRKSTAGSLARRDSSLNYSYMNEVYAIIEKHGLDRIKDIHKRTTYNKSNYELDVFSAHPTMLKFEKMPIDGFLQTDFPHDNMLNFYIYHGKAFTDGCLITDDMKNYIESHDYGTCEYVFSTPYKIGTYPGDWLYKKAHDTKESKQEIKEIRYGYYQKPYLKLSYKKDCYVRYDNHIYELLICQIFSQLLYYMMQLYDILNGNAIIVDAVEFECYNEDTVSKVKSVLPSYIDFRIRDSEGYVKYQSYAELKTKSEKKKEQHKQWYANLTPEQREERNRKERERRAKKKEAHDEQK